MHENLEINQVKYIYKHNSSKILFSTSLFSLVKIVIANFLLLSNIMLNYYLHFTFTILTVKIDRNIFNFSQTT